MSNFQPTLSREDLGPDYPQMTHYLVRTNLLFEGDSLSADNLDALFNDTADFARCLGWVSIRTLLHINLNSHEEIQVEEWLLGKRVKDFNTQKDIDDHFDVNTLTERVNQQEPNLYFGPYALEDSDLKEAREAHQILSHALEQARLDQKIFFLPFSVLRPTGTINPRNATGRGYTMLADFPERYGQPSYITLFQIHRKPGSPQSQFVTWACDSRTDGCNAGDYYFTYENAVEGYLRRLLKLR